jgi:DNA-3-methyladenine glycosylase
VEVEAYVGLDDRASHAHVGPTDRNRAMFGPPGVAYVYLVYGMHHCLNVVTDAAGRPAALLIRAVAPLEGVAAMRAARIAAGAARRRIEAPAPALDADARRITAVEAETRRLEVLDAARLASGPALVAAAFGLDRSWTGRDLCDPRSALRIELPAPDWDGAEPARVIATPRIGIDGAGEPWVSRPWRFLLSDEPSVSGARPGARASAGLRPAGGARVRSTVERG